MSNRHLFRGKRLYGFKAGMWVSGVLGNRVMWKEGKAAGMEFAVEYIETKEGTPFVTSHLVDPATIGQCTGLKDKNGNLIFEGDIVKRESSAKYAFEVFAIVWHENGFFMENKSSRFYLDTKTIASSETVGNIHDNPQLLEAGV